MRKYSSTGRTASFSYWASSVLSRDNVERTDFTMARFLKVYRRLPFGYVTSKNELPLEKESLQ